MAVSIPVLKPRQLCHGHVQNDTYQGLPSYTCTNLRSGAEKEMRLGNHSGLGM